MKSVQSVRLSMDALDNDIYVNDNDVDVNDVDVSCMAIWYASIGCLVCVDKQANCVPKK